MPIDFDRLTSPDLLDGLVEWPLEKIRALRSDCQETENALSLVRRVIHGRLDIVGGEIARRQAGRDQSSLSELIATLPTLLADSSRPPGNPRPPQPIGSTELADELIDELDQAVGATALAALSELSDDEVAERVVALDAHERLLSTRRRRLHEQIDALQAEITRRYRTGEASVDSLLS